MEQRCCLACDKPLPSGCHGLRKYCDPECRRLHSRDSRRTEMVTADCRECGVSFTGWPKSGHAKLYCTDRCARTASRKRARQRLKETECKHCGESFTTNGYSEQVYCKAECHAEAKRWRRLVPAVAIPWATCTQCSTAFIRRTTAKRCTACQSRWRPTTTKEQRQRYYLAWRERNPPRPRRPLERTCEHCNSSFSTTHPRAKFCSKRCSRSSLKDRRRARKRGQFVERVVRRQVYERDGWRCQLCGWLVDVEALVPDPLSPTLDHRIPIAKGGAHSYANTQCAHFICNSLKSDGHVAAKG